MVASGSIALNKEQKQILITSAASRMSGLEADVFDRQLQELLTLLPDLRDRLLSLSPAILVELAADTAGVALKLIQLREWFPAANLGMLLARRPTLLTAAEWGGVAAARDKLHAMFPEGGVDDLVTRQPLLLVEDVDELVGELERLLLPAEGGECSSGGSSTTSGTTSTSSGGPQPPAAAPGLPVRLRRGPGGRDLLRADPDLLLAVMSNRRLSLWLLPGVDMRLMLARNPGIVTELQRGPGALGPGAEFMAGPAGPRHGGPAQGGPGGRGGQAGGAGGGYRLSPGSDLGLGGVDWL
ncbi:hypothetical protein CHLRE_08g385600v5 [Chlamydomonas reinhardtii]|uniref:Uncharacterized protein n=1 Tax=Chlamydomonas reinhardtii TaxID=3055 RepID=A0A2K3DIC9_CHLRE|nr:uncharacterized protein CHLRE_08g385600v5 [Chlamydomonas reinhardtii]PNW80289.1 hypothetical protein CHLRE_08g385600v5 [Chlamydomonas reinhardtii]